MVTIIVINMSISISINTNISINMNITIITIIITFIITINYERRLGVFGGVRRSRRRVRRLGRSLRKRDLLAFGSRLERVVAFDSRKRAGRVLLTEILPPRIARHASIRG